ncbi:MAG TPA: hypothetical protein VL157_02295 [Gemmatimonadaceae bacterium]|nr:hypothetical protein [Gemmatimonadaceae bacterium]
MTLPPIVRRLRGVARMARLWSVAWLPAGVALVTLVFRPSVSDEPGSSWNWRLMAIRLVVWCTWGALSGAVFAVALMLAERRRGLAELSMTRTAVWGAVGSASAPAVLMTIAYFEAGPREPLPYLIFVAATASLGAAMAAASLALARRAPR